MQKAVIPNRRFNFKPIPINFIQSHYSSKLVAMSSKKPRESKRKRMLRLDKRDKGIDQKNVFFVKRYNRRERSSYFDITIDKEICNEDLDEEICKFYLKVGGVTFLEPIAVAGQHYREAKQRLRQSKHFGTYLFYSTSDDKLRGVIYAKKKLFSPGDVLLSRSSAIHSVIPRYDGYSNPPKVITGIQCEFRTGSTRQWRRFDGSDIEYYNGFHDIWEDEELKDIDLTPKNYWRPKESIKTAIYVPKNTSLVVQDGGRAFAFIDYAYYMGWTLLQEGAILMTNFNFTFVFYDENDGDEYDFELVYRLKRDRFDCPGFELLAKNDMNRLLVLSPPPTMTAWMLRICKIERQLDWEAQLCVPSDGRLQQVFDWDTGLEQVDEWQARRPWNKYIEPHSYERRSRPTGLK